MRSENDFAAALIRHAARRAPDVLSDRLEEEWLADLTGRHGSWQRLRLALGCVWATRIIAADHLASGAGQTITLATHDNTATLASDDPSLFSRRSIVLLMILSVHALLVYGFISGLATRIVHAVTPVNGFFVELPKIPRPQDKPPTLAASLGLRRPEKLVYQQIDIEPTADESRIPPVVTDLPPDRGTAVSIKPPVRHVGGPTQGFPATEDFYPAGSRRVGEQGIATVRVCVDATGHLTTEPSIAQSSGTARLDDGALELARAGSGFYRSTVEDGHPIADCYAFRVHFVLNR